MWTSSLDCCCFSYHYRSIDRKGIRSQIISIHPRQKHLKPSFLIVGADLVLLPDLLSVQRNCTLKSSLGLFMKWNDTFVLKYIWNVRATNTCSFMCALSNVLFSFFLILFFWLVSYWFSCVFWLNLMMCYFLMH